MPRAVADRTAILPALAEVFREHGYDGASLALLGERTGLGKGSLYHFFPGGKEEMAAAVLAEIGAWFETAVFTPLQEAADARQAIDRMMQSVEDYFRSGRRVCLVGAFALGDARDRFATQVHAYFARWNSVLAQALIRHGHDAKTAKDLAEDCVAGIQGALVLARALNDSRVFHRALERMRARLIKQPVRRR